MSRVRVKVCGITKASQAQALVDLGVDALGLIFYKKSPRGVSIEVAREIRRVIPAFVSVVGVFVDHTAQEINEICSNLKLNLIQLHGDQSPEFAEQLDSPYVKAVRVESLQKIKNEVESYKGATSFLLDTFSKDAYGGTGHRIDDALLPENLSERYILAGGINLDNIDDVLLKKPYAIDINSGVELSPGNKNISAIAEVMAKVRRIN